MATTYKADNYSEPFPALPFPNVLIRHFKFTQTAAFVIEDVVSLVPIQALTGLVLDSFFINVPDLDTGGTPAITLDLGFNGTNKEDDLVDGSTVGQAAGIIDAADAVAAALPLSITEDCILQLHVDAAPQTGTDDAVIKGWMMYHYMSQAIVL